MWVVPTKVPPAKPPSKVAGVVDAIESLERRRRSSTASAKPAGRRGDLDLNGIR